MLRAAARGAGDLFPMRDACAAFFSLSLSLVSLCGCEERERPLAYQAQCEPKKDATNAPDAGPSTPRRFAPLERFDVYLNGFHPMRDDPALAMEAHHYCRITNQDVAQCVIFDAGEGDANLVGVEYIVSSSTYARLPEDEKQFWHPHNFEILSGLLVAPDLRNGDEKILLARMMNGYGKTWHIWDTANADRRGDELPLGEPMLAWSYNHDDEVSAAMIEARDRRAHVSTAEKRSARIDLTPLAQPQEGVDDLSPFFRGPQPRPPGVRAKAAASTRRKR